MGKRILCLLLCGCLVFGSAAAEDVVEPTDAVESAEGVTEAAVDYFAMEQAPAPELLPILCGDVSAQLVDGEAYLFLPSHADLTALTLTFDAPITLAMGEQAIRSGEAFDLTAVEPKDGEYLLTMDDGASLHVMQSANLRTVYLISDDPAQGRMYVDGSPEHATRAAARAVIRAIDGGVDYEGAIAELRGRGNTTWEWGKKKPYQLKLAKKADLLNTGDDDNAAKKWVLLAEAFDATLIHNTLSYALAAALGLPYPETEPVDLYYDGEYRGTYLLAEKTEINEGRLNLLDYDKAVERMYGGDDLDSLPVATAENAYGQPYQYVDELEIDSGATMSFLAEIDEYFYQEERCWITTKRGLHVTIQTPEAMSKADGAYIGGLFQRIENALWNNGVDPESERDVSELLDLDSMARFWILSEYAKNPDYWRGSTYFYKQARDEKLYVGPVWDFDIAYGIRPDYEATSDGYLRTDGWIAKLTALPAFQATVKRIYDEEFLPLLNVVMGDTDAQTDALHSAAWYADRIADSRRMNDKLWAYGGGYHNINRDTVFTTYEQNYAYFKDYLVQREAWMTADIAAWSAETIERCTLSLTYRNANIVEHAKLAVDNLHANAALTDVTITAAEKLADEPYYTRYVVDATLTANVGSVFAMDAEITINGGAPEIVSSTENERKLRFSFIAPTFEPAEYDGVDYSLLYQYDWFVARNPEVAEECGADDPETMLAYYVDYGMSEELSGIETYDSQTFIDNYLSLMDAYYMCEPYSCAMHYLENCYAEDLLGMAEDVRPEILAE